MGLGQGIALAGVLVNWNALADPYCVSRYFIFSVLCLAYSITTKPRFGHLSIVGLLYMVALIAFSLLAWKQVCFIGRSLNYFTACLPLSLVAIAYHYSIGDRWERIANAYIIGCVIACLAGIAQTQGMLQPQQDYFDGRIYALVGSPVFLAGTLALAVPLCLGRLYTPFALPLLGFGLIFTQSRSGLIAAAAGVLGYCFSRGFIGWKTATGIACLVLALTMGAFSGLRNVSRSDKGRVHMARVAIRAIADHPFGIGPERFAWAMETYRDEALDKDLSPTWTNAYAHNQILEALLIGGPIFLVIHLLLVSAVGLFVYRSGNSAVFGACCALGAFGMMQPTPLAIKCVLGALAGSLEPSHREWPEAKPIFVLAASLAFIASLSAVTMAKIYEDGNRMGLAQITIDAFDYQPSAKRDE